MDKDGGGVGFTMDGHKQEECLVIGGKKKLVIGGKKGIRWKDCDDRPAALKISK